MPYMRRMALAAALFVLFACGGSTTPAAVVQSPAPTAEPSESPNPPDPTPNQSPSPTPSASPGASASPRPSPYPSGGAVVRPSAGYTTCSSPIPAGHQLALVQLVKTSGVVVRDITNIASPITRCAIYGGGFHRFVDDNHVSYITTTADGQGALFVVDLRNSADTLIRSWTNQGSLYWVYGWSPDGKSLTYLSSNGDRVAWHLRTLGNDVILSDLGSIPGRGVDPNNDDAMVGFSADGQYVALEHTFKGPSSSSAAPFQVVRVSDRKLVYSRTDGSMAVWATGAGARLYFSARTSDLVPAVQVWDIVNGAAPIVFGLNWIHPRPSADGKLIVFEITAGEGNHYMGYLQVATVYLFHFMSRSRANSMFLTPSLIWNAGETICVTECGPGEPRLNGQTYIMDVVTAQESPSIIRAVFDAWPHYS